MKKLINRLNPGAVVNEILNTYKYSKELELESEKLQANREIIIKKMKLNHEFYKNIFYEVFKERRLAMNKSFELIDRGVLENNRDYISLGLQSLTQVVISSPFKDAKELSEMLESNKKIEI